LRVEQEGGGKPELGAYRAAPARTESVYAIAWREYRGRIRLNRWGGVLFLVAMLFAIATVYAGAKAFVFISVIIAFVGAFMGLLSHVSFPCPRCGTDWSVPENRWPKQCAHCGLRYGQDPSR
jgi:hypothetical protein